MFSPVSEIIVDDDDITVITSNVSNGSMTSLESAFSSFAPRQQSKWAYATRTIASNEAIADSGATQIFVMDGTPVHNKQKRTCPLKVALADGRWVLQSPVQLVWVFFLIFPFGRGIYPKSVGRYLDIRLCSIPTVGVYKKQGKLHLTCSTSYLLYYSSPKRAPSPLLLDGLLYSWWFCRNRPHSWGKVCEF